MGIYGDYVALFVIAAVGTYVLTFPTRTLAARIGAVAQPSEDHVHLRATPSLGGAAMFGAFGLTMFVASRFSALGQVFHGSSEPIGVVLAGLVIYLVGAVDDVRSISAPAKVAGQVLAAMVLVGLGVTMYYFKIPFVAGLITLSPSVLPLVTALWVVGMTNSLNLIDGLDGLAAGIVAIASGALGIYGLRLVVLGDLSPDNLGPLIAVIACGVCVGFLPHNFHPARVFMGDGGALFLGLLMAASTMVIGGRTENVAGANTGGVDVTGLTFFRFAPLFIPFFILGVPILDTAFAIIRRTVHRSSVAERDLDHLHHRLVRLGHGHRRAVLILWVWTAALSVFVLVPTFEHEANPFVPSVAVLLGVGLYTVFRPGRRSTSETRPKRRRQRIGAHSASTRLLRAEKDQSEPRTTGPITVVVSGAVSVAVAGEPNLTKPRRRRRGRRLARLRRPSVRREAPEAVLSGEGSRHVAGSNDEVPG